MSITSGIGLVSGIDSQSLIQQLLSIDARPQVLAQQRIIQLKQQQAAYLDVNSRLLSLKTAAGSFNTDKLFASSTATSSDPETLLASAGKNAAAGAYKFIAHRLVSTQQMLSKGFTDSDTSGVGASTFTFETGGGGLIVDNELSELNGGNGVKRGVFTIEDASGNEATIDLSTAVTVDEVLNAINAQSSVDLTATVNGDGIQIVHNNGETFTITDSFGDQMAADLGIAGASTGDTLTGSNIRTVSGGSAVSLLNDGNGVHFNPDGGTISHSGTKNLNYDLDIIVNGNSLKVGFGKVIQLADPADEDDEDEVVETAATTLQDIIDRINAASADSATVDVTASLNDAGTGIKIVDNTASGDIEVKSNDASRQTAEDLGIATGGALAANEVQGDRVIASLNSTLSKSLLGGQGLESTDLDFTSRAGGSVSVTLNATDLTGSLSDVIDTINTQLAGSDMSVAINDAGNGLQVLDASGGAGNLIIQGKGADELGISTSAAGVASSSHNGVSAQQKWISYATKLSELNGGKGIGTGQIRITDASGIVTNLTVGSSIKTVEQLTDFLSNSPANITATLNSTGDGIQIVDDSGGTGSLIIEDVSGNVADNLNIEGTFEDEGSGIVADGTYEIAVEFDANDTLDEIAAKINAAGVGMTASVLNDGSPNAPFHLNLTAKGSGKSGVTIVDTGGLDLGFDTLSEGQDAVAFYGADDPSDAFLITSSSNQVSGVIQGVTIDLEGTSPDPVEVVVEQDLSPVTSKIDELVSAFNNVLTAIDGYDSYNQETEKKGILLGDQGVRNVKSRLIQMVQSPAVGISSQFTYLFEIGISLGEGSKLEFDQEEFEAAYAADPEGVEAMLSASKLAPKDPIEVAPGVTVKNTEDSYLEQGIFERLEELINDFTNSVDGALTIRKNNFDTQIALQEDRVEQMQKTLDSKQAILEQQFLAMEKALASLQTQQQALATLQGAG